MSDQTVTERLDSEDLGTAVEELAANGREPPSDREWFGQFEFCGLYRQRSEQDPHFMLRVPSCGGTLNAGQLRTVGELVRDYASAPVENPEWGDGWIDLTTGQSIELHWIHRDDVPEILETLDATGVVAPPTAVETTTSLRGCPVAGKAAEYVETRPIIEELHETDALDTVPPGFTVSVSGCRQGCVSDAVDDIELEAAWKSASTERRVGFNVRVGGEVGPREPRRARSLDLFVPPERAVDAVHALVAYYHDTRDGSQFVVEDRETGAIRDAVAARLEVESAGQPLHDAEETDKPRWDGLHDHVGVYEQRDGLNYVGLSVPLGRLTAKETIALAHLASEYGSGELRLTRRQNPVMMDVPDRNVAPLLSEPLLETHTPEPGPFVRGARACAGAEFCSLALTETKVRMAATLRWLRANVAVPEDVGQIAIHYSGCTADCAGAMTADIGLQGMQVPKNGEMVAAADVGVGGGLDDSPRFVEWLHQRVPVDELPGLLRNLVKAFGANREEGQSFRAWVDETGVEAIAAMAEPTETDYVDPCLTDAAGSWYPYEQHRTPTTPGDTPISADD